jgi:hypothetical protein
MITVVNLQQVLEGEEKNLLARIETFNGVLETYFLAFQQFSELFLALRLQEKNCRRQSCKNESVVQCFEVLDGAMAPTLLTKKLGECARSIRTPHMHYIYTTYMHRE